MRQVDIQARSVDEAVRLALEQLGRTRDQVRVEVLATDPGGDEVLVRVTAPDLPGAGAHEEVSPRPARRQEVIAPRERVERSDQAEPEAGDNDNIGNRLDSGERNGPASQADRGDRGNRNDRFGGRDRGNRPGMGGGGGNRYGRPGAMSYRQEPAYDPDIPGEIELDSSLQLPEEGAQAAVEGNESLAPQAAEILQNILLGMKVRGRIVRREQQEEGEAAFADDKDSIVLNVVDLNERDQTALIGRRGETLDAIQFLVNLILSRKAQTWARITVDVEGYRLRRKHALINLARRTADQVQTRGQAIPLEAMPAHERRIVHMTLADHPNVVTESAGVEPERRVVVLPR